MLRKSVGDDDDDDFMRASDDSIPFMDHDSSINSIQGALMMPPLPDEPDQLNEARESAMKSESSQAAAALVSEGRADADEE